MKKLIKIGFWSDKRSMFSFLSGYPDPRDHVDPSWGKGLREFIAKYLEAGDPIASYMGYSYCRFGCTKNDEQGTRDFSDGVYVWPEGYPHYIRRHDVVPPQHFLKHVYKWMQNAPKTLSLREDSPPNP
jgi:hypothetical protein